jgi:aminoglycoside phosphotransferase (APT) family kinase protein
MTPEAEARLARWLGNRLGAALTITAMKPLSGGAIQENWLLDCLLSGTPASFVIRKDAVASIASSHGRREEFALLRLAHAGGITVPEPVAFCEDAAVIGGPFAVMRKVEGVGFGPKVVKDETLAADREVLGQRLGRELARIHRLDASGLVFLGERPSRPAADLVERLRSSLDAMAIPHPVLEWGLRFVETQAPVPPRITLCHHDFRTGNFMVDTAGLTAILDWEFAGWGDPMADLGWFTAECWRFSRPDREGGGVTSRAAFYAGYERESGQRVDHKSVLFWEIVAHLRWAVIALEQGQRHVSGREPSLALALTGRMAAELAAAALALTMPAAWQRHA